MFAVSLSLHPSVWCVVYGDGGAVCSNGVQCVVCDDGGVVYGDGMWCLMMGCGVWCVVR